MPKVTDKTVKVQMFFCRPGSEPLKLNLGLVKCSLLWQVAALVDYLLVCGGQSAVNLRGEQVRQGGRAQLL